MANENLFGLVCTGGGAHGAYQVGVLKYIHEFFCHGDQSPFSIFTGCSCGALNTSFYAAQSYDARQSRLRLEELWMSFHVPGFHGNLLKNALTSTLKQWAKPTARRNSTWSLLDAKPLHEIVAKGFLRKNLDRAFAEGTTQGIGVAGTELVSGRCCWFLDGKAAKEWNLFHSIGKPYRMRGQHIVASCSVPIFFPPVKIGSRYFLDGSVSMDRPLSAAVSMGANHILSIGTDKPHPDELPTYRPNFIPKLSSVIRMLLNQLSFDTASAEAVQIEVLNSFYSALSRKSRKEGRKVEALPLFHKEAIPGHYQPITVYQIHPSARIRQTSVDEQYNKGKIVKRKRTRFMFHRKFIRELIDMGYEDAKARQDDLMNFFELGEKGKRWRLFRKR
ncbi:MAG: patatin-like phospholipase family protein [Candidatus Omnitrophota bacterium]|nr:patatin-like phospholipase family protein [Candidatus Omnitrophota bacterium]